MKTSRRPMMVLFALAIGLLLFVVYAGYASFWTDSEIWGTVAVRHMFHGQGFYDFNGKPFFHLILWFSGQASDAMEVHPIYLARLLFALNSFIMVLLFQRLTLYLSGNVFVSLALSLLLFSNSIFIKRFGEVRSDALVTTLVLAWWWMQTTRWWLGLRPYQRLAGSLVTVGLITAVTPKSLLFTIPWLALKETDNLRRLAVRNRKTVLWCALAVMLAVAAVISHSIDFFLNSIDTGPNEMAYFDPNRLEHVWRLVRENPWILLAWYFSFHYGVLRRRHTPVVARLYMDFAGICLLGLAVYPDRLPFLIASILPYWLIPIAAQWPSLKASPWMERFPRRRIFILVLLFGSANAVFWSLFVLNNNSNANQKIFINWIYSNKEALQGVPMYDAAGVAPFAGAEHWFVGPSEPYGNSEVAKRVRTMRPELIFYVTKMGYLGREMDGFLKQNYRNDGAGIFILQHPLEIKAGAIPILELRANVFKSLPFLEHVPKHVFYIELRGPNGVDLSGYAKWRRHDGGAESFDGRISLNDLDRYAYLEVPRGATQLMILAVKISTPFSLNWAELFRFNPEI